MSRLIDAVLGLSGPTAYALVGLLAFGEAAVFVGLVLPGEIAVLLGGVIASNGGVSLGWMVVVASVAAVAGDSAGYEVGRRVGHRLLAWPPFHRRFGDKVQRASAYLEQRGGRAVFAGRWTSVLRALVPGLAGMARMPYRRFLLANVVGGTAWATTFVVAGYLAGSSWRRVEHAAGRASLLLLATIVVIVAIRWLTRRAAANAETVRRWVDRGASSAPAVWVRQRFDRQVTWLRRRMDPTAAFGLSWSIGVLVAGAGAWLMGVMVQDLLGRDEVGLLDRPLHTWVAAHTTPEAVTIASTVRTALTPPVGFLLVAVAAALAWRWHGRRGAVRLAATSSAVTLIAVLLRTVLPTTAAGARFPSVAVAALTAAVVSLVPAAARRGMPFAIRTTGIGVGVVLVAAAADLISNEAALTGLIGAVGLGALAATLAELAAMADGRAGGAGDDTTSGHAAAPVVR